MYNQDGCMPILAAVVFERGTALGENTISFDFKI